MALVREPIYAALLSRLTAGLTAAGVTVVTGPSRAFRDVDQVRPEMQPAVFISQSTESPAYLPQGQGLPAKWILRPSIFVFARTDQESGAVPSSVLNPILDGVEKSLEWQPGDGAPGLRGETTLGGLCTYCRISEVAVAEGLLDDGQGIAVVSLELLALGGA